MRVGSAAQRCSTCSRRYSKWCGSRKKAVRFVVIALQNSHDLLAAVVGQHLAVLGEAPQLQRAQPAREPAVDELALLIGQIDAGELLDERAQRLEILVAEGELPQPVHRDGVAEEVGYQELAPPSEELDAAFVRMQRGGRHAAAPETGSSRLNRMRCESEVKRERMFSTSMFQDF